MDSLSDFNRSLLRLIQIRFNTAKALERIQADIDETMFGVRSANVAGSTAGVVGSLLMVTGNNQSRFF